LKKTETSFGWDEVKVGDIAAIRTF
jgi:hypothetical protein